MDEYLKTLLEQIRCKKARPYVKQEFQDHIEDQIEANMQAGMDREQAEREAVRDMGDPVETGISLDSVHRPQVAWKLLGIIVLISIAGVLIHAGIAGKISENAAAGSDRYVFHVVIGLAVYDDFISSGLHCTGKIFENNCRHFTVCLSGYIVGWLSVKWGKILHCTAGRKRNIHADSDAVLCSHIWSNFV